MDNVVLTQITGTSDRAAALFARIARVTPILADLSRADILIGVPRANNRIEIVAQAQPHSVAPVHRVARVGQFLTRSDASALFRAIEARQFARGLREYSPTEAGIGEGGAAPVVQEAYPIEAEESRIVGGLLIETNLLESERLKRRSEVFQRVLKFFQQSALRGEPEGIETLAPFGEHDGIIVADSDGVIRYMSGIATNLYRNIGYGEPLLGKPLSYLELQDDELVRQALATRRCAQITSQERGRTWVKKVVPIIRAERTSLFSQARTGSSLALLLLHDDTEAREREQELLIQATMIKELHHRVKNDLQTVASLLRMQARRLQTTEAKSALAEAVNRILSIAVIHEFLSVQDTRAINIREVAQRIVQQMESAILDPDRRIRFTLEGPNIYLPARQATSCALVVNELLQNALEHGYDSRATGGTIALTFEDHGDAVGLVVHDDGHALPPDFSLERVDSLGLRIVRMLVTQDLKGQIELQSDHGVSANVRFPKISLGGEAWKELE
jgi:two-component sensor histidine kinase/PAS domain-containing protein